MEKYNLTVLLEFGSETGLEYLYRIDQLGIKISSIICVGDEYSKKRKKLLKLRTGGLFKRRSFSNFLKDKNIPIYIIEDVNSQNCSYLLESLKPDLVVFEGSKIIRNKIYTIPKYGMLNVHLGILPYLRGCSCMEWSILENYPIGLTCHYLIGSVDSGAIINRFQLKISETDSYFTLRAKLLHLSAYSVATAVQDIIQKGFRKENAYLQEKGPWFSPLKDLDLIAKMKEMVEFGDYKPRNIKDNIPLITVDVNLENLEIVEL